MSKAKQNTDTHYHDQPHTLDPNVKTPEDPPLAQGHDSEDADDVAAAMDAHRAQVESERGADPVGARQPGDHAGSDKDKDKDKDKGDDKTTHTSAHKADRKKGD